MLQACITGVCKSRPTRCFVPSREEFRGAGQRAHICELVAAGGAVGVDDDERALLRRLPHEPQPAQHGQ